MSYSTTITSNRLKIRWGSARSVLFSDSSVLQRMQSAPAHRVKRARKALLGLVDIPGSTIYVRPEISLADLPPLVLHETAHAYLDWQRDLYLYVQEDDACCIASDLKDQFESEANRFAWELIFQVDRFHRDAEKGPFSLETPVKLANRYGTGVYPAVRWFVETNSRQCACLFTAARAKAGSSDGGHESLFNRQLLRSVSETFPGPKLSAKADLVSFSVVMDQGTRSRYPISTRGPLNAKSTRSRRLIIVSLYCIRGLFCRWSPSLEHNEMP